MRYEYNEDFFESKSLESCYWAGFVAGDGWIYKTPGRKPSVSIELASVDRLHLMKISESVGGPVSHRDRLDKRTNKVYHSSRWTAYSHKIADDLEKNFNIIPAKSLIAEPPTGLDEQQTYSFIAGMYDSDGHYGYTDGKRPRAKLVGTKAMMSWVNDHLYDGAYKVSVNDKNSKNALYCISSSGDRAIIGRSKYIDIDLPFLERKYRYWENNGINLEVLSDTTV